MYHFVVLPWLWPCVCLSEDQQERKTQSETMDHGPWTLNINENLAGGQRAGWGGGERGCGGEAELKS